MLSLGVSAASDSGSGNYTFYTTANSSYAYAAVTCDCEAEIYAYAYIENAVDYVEASRADTGTYVEVDVTSGELLGANDYATIYSEAFTLYEDYYQLAVWEPTE